jgi:hypothetical protein
VLDPPIVSILNQRLNSELRVEIEEVVRASRTGQVNLSALADQIHAALDDLREPQRTSSASLELPETTTSGSSGTPAPEKQARSRIRSSFSRRGTFPNTGAGDPPRSEAI